MINSDICFQYEYATVINLQPKYIDMGDGQSMNFSVLMNAPTTNGCGQLLGIWLGLDHRERGSWDVNRANQKSIVIHNFP